MNLSLGVELPQHVLWGSDDSDQSTVAFLKEIENRLHLFVYTVWDDGRSLEVMALAQDGWEERYSCSTEYDDDLELVRRDLDRLMAAWPAIPNWKDEDEPQDGAGQTGP